MHIAAKDGMVFAAENARHRVVRFDRDGKMVGAWGRMDRTGVEGFGSCCNPMNIYFGADGLLYTAEATLGRIKRYTPDGQFKGVVGTAKISAGCINVTIAASRDGQRFYMLDRTGQCVRVLPQ